MPPPPTEPPPGWDQELEDLLTEAVEAAERGDRAEVQRILDAHGNHAAAIQTHLRQLGMLGLMATDADEPRPEQIGPYKILDVLGSGGMGVVYLAEQKEPVRRRVALKVIKLGMDSKQVLARFQAERQALAMMNHDCIAKVFDAGTTDRGQPFFAMEHVPGLPLTEHCDKHKLTIEARLLLFQKVCAGVQHAHQKGVIHRDLKPGNVLVTQAEGEAIPKIIDFGLARATDHRLLAATLYTEQGMVLGTPEYMSPEQAEMSSQDIDTRTDVYSLGVMLYELLVGALPFSAKELRAAGLHEIHRKIREDEPPKPSTRLREAGQATTRTAERRRTSVVALLHRLRGDLDWIVGKAMEKDRSRRYETAAALADDLRRHLANEPVVARPPSAGYLLRKLGRRYRRELVSAGLVVAALVAGLVGMWVLWREARAQAAEATRQEGIATERTRAAEDARAGEAARAEEAAWNAGRAQAALLEYRRLEAVATLESLRTEEESLPSPWPEHVATLLHWVERAERLLNTRRDIEITVATLRARALPVADPERERRSHPNYMQWVVAQQRLASLRRADAIRSGAASLLVPELTAAQRDATPPVLLQMAWPRVSIFHWTDRHFGDEALGLALARLAMEKLHGGDAAEVAKAHLTLACAWFANGREEETHAEIQRVEALGQAVAHEAPLRWLRAGLERQVTPGGIGHLAIVSHWEADERRLDERISQRRRWSFAEPSDEAVHSALTRFLEELTLFEATVLPRARQHLAWAGRIEALSIAGHADRWQAARLALRSADGVAASTAYSAVPIDLAPQIGLVPIGMNPATKLWEFYDLGSAKDPAAIPQHQSDGSLAIAPDSGLVLVLIPGGVFLMGAQRLDPKSPGFDPLAQSSEFPVHRAELAPFFLSRYEVTQAQWARWTQTQPSSFNPPAGAPTHPVENIRWDTCLQALHRQGLTLPTEAQWEYACRAGQPTAWWPGSTPEALEGCAKLRLAGAPFTVSIPVGSLRPNPFGLHDVHGNVREWVLDRAVSYLSPLQPGEGRRVGWGSWLARGGCWNSPPAAARCSARLPHDEAAALRGPDQRVHIGVRPSRALLSAPLATNPR